MEEIPLVTSRRSGVTRVLVRDPILLHRLALGALVAKHPLLVTTGRGLLAGQGEDGNEL